MLMEKFFETISEKIANNEELFYNTSGNKYAFKLGVKHLSSALYLNIAHEHQNVLYITRDFTLVDFENERFTLITEGSKMTLNHLEIIK